MRFRLACASTLFAALWLAQPLAQPTTASFEGRVYLDANANGIRDTGEAGLPGVAVSNQRDVVQTGVDGTFRLAGPGTGVVFVSVPDGFGASESFWRVAGGDLTFGLRRRPAAASFTFVHASDPHTAPESVERLRQARALAEARRPDFVLMTGDLVKDAIRVGEGEASGYYQLYQDEVARFTMPVWSVPGNHENFGIERHLSLVAARHPLYGKGMYRARLGPNYYSFTRGGIHFVGLDTVDVADLWYYGHVDDAQLAWLRADLAAVPADMPVVTFNHIPLVSAAEMIKGYTDDGAAPTTLRVNGKTTFRHVVSNLSAVATAIQPHPWPLALGGHIHLRELLRYGSTVTTRFEQAAAIVGGGSGPVPARSGITIYTVDRGRIDLGEFLPLD